MNDIKVDPIHDSILGEVGGRGRGGGAALEGKVKKVSAHSFGINENLLTDDVIRTFSV